MAPRIPEPHLTAWRALLSAHTELVARIEAELADAGLPPLAWYDVLWAVRRAPKRRRRMSELAADLTLSRGGMTKLVGRLEEEGLLRREPASADGRGSYAVLTDAGNAMLRRMWVVYGRALQVSFVPHVTAEEAAAIASGLGRAAAAPLASA
jgi:DNA-binding MarR family transcriptional regulator